MDIIQTFYDNLAPQYEDLFLDWEDATYREAEIIHKIIKKYGYGITSHILDCACGIGTQVIGIARLGYNATGSDISKAELEQAKNRAEKAGVNIRFEAADFCRLSDTFNEKFDIIMAMDNALPHMLSHEDLQRAVVSITQQLNNGGLFIGSMRDYDGILNNKPPYSPPYVHKTDKLKRVAFQTWDWDDDIYKLTQYIINDGDNLSVSKFVCAYRATKRDELTDLFKINGCRDVTWIYPEESGFYQPIITAKK